MKKWEYCELYYDLEGDTISAYWYNRRAEQENTRGGEAFGDWSERFMVIGDLGSDGWELVSVILDENQKPRFFFKRLKKKHDDL